MRGVFHRRGGQERQFGPLSTNIAINIYFFHFLIVFMCTKPSGLLDSLFIHYVVLKDFHMLKGSLIKGSLEYIWARI